MEAVQLAAQAVYDKEQSQPMGVLFHSTDYMSTRFFELDQTVGAVAMAYDNRLGIVDGVPSLQVVETGVVLDRTRFLGEIQIWTLGVLEVVWAGGGV